MTDTKPVIDPKKRAFLEALGIKIPTGQKVYDAIMGTVEPELVTANLPTLDAPYAAETAEEHKARYNRYTKAFAEYHRLFKEWIATFQNAAKEFRHSLIRSAEEASKVEEAAALTALESQMYT